MQALSTLNDIICYGTFSLINVVATCYSFYIHEISSGRVDALDPSAVTPDGRLPGADSGPPGADPSDAAHLRTIFNRMGFDDQEIVALSGAHALGRW